MNVLYVEDEEVKAKEVLASLDERYNVDFRKSLSGGLSAIQEKQYDLVLLDMSLPLYDYDSEDEDENDFETFAGIDILEELIRKSRNDKVVVITAFDILGEGENEITMLQLDTNLQEEYREIYLGLIYYDSSSLEWRRTLQSILEEMR
ncbi:MAG: hypothetical protein K2G55_18910 [Lachnospiraceae bacterium]|nr:hypothetical protein [Lachnospiraceae bacterium]